MIAELRIQISDPADFGKVAVVYGGLSTERDISILTGEAVLSALQERAVDAHAVDAGHDLLEVLSGGYFDRVWIALHGRGGEDGSLQGALQLMNMPYTGSGVQGSALAMDKLRSKILFVGSAIPTPPFMHVEDTGDLQRVLEEIGVPVAMKPVCEGSSLGMSKVTDASELEAAYRAACKHDLCVIAEKWVEGGEYTTGILQGEALPIIRIETPRRFYDYEAKYFTDSTEFHCPAGLTDGQESRFRQLSLKAFVDVGGQGWGRVDFILDQDAVPQVLEVNTVPGMTSHSLVPMAAQQHGIDFQELCWRILETSFISRESTGAADA